MKKIISTLSLFFFVLVISAQSTITLTGTGTVASTTASTTTAGGNSLRVGSFAGSACTTTNTSSTGNNLYIGTNAGKLNVGSGNLFLGNNSGANSTLDSNKLFISNSNSATPLIWGDFSLSQLKLNGKVGIGSVTTFPNTLYPNYRLFVTGGILTDEVRILLSSNGTWADYVFSKDYKLKTLTEVETYISKYGHLPNMPSGKEVKEDGVNVFEMARIQQEKIEELTLYIIQQNKRIEVLESKLK